MESNYYDLRDILCGQELTTVSWNIDQPGLGFLSNQNGERVVCIFYICFITRVYIDYS